MTQPDKATSGVLRGIAVRPVDGDAMREIPSCRVEPGRGIDTENRKPGKREVTLLSFESWGDVCRELGTELSWHARRANLLIEGVDLAAAIGRTLHIADVRIRIHGETRPCGIMDQQHAGLRQTLVPQVRGGVQGEVLAGGDLHLGNVVTVVD